MRLNVFRTLRVTTQSLFLERRSLSHLLNWTRWWNGFDLCVQHFSDCFGFSYGAQSKAMRTDVRFGTDSGFKSDMKPPEHIKAHLRGDP